MCEMIDRKPTIDSTSNHGITLLQVNTHIRARTCIYSIFLLCEVGKDLFRWPIHQFKPSCQIFLLCMTQLDGDIEFEDVTFAYPTRPDRQVFQGFSLVVPAGLYWLSALSLLTIVWRSTKCWLLHPKICDLVTSFARILLQELALLSSDQVEVEKAQLFSCCRDFMIHVSVGYVPC